MSMGAKKVLVLDVDETLLTIEPVHYLNLFHKDFKKMPGKVVTFPESKKEYYLMARPRAKEFLDKAQTQFTLVAYSVVAREYTREKLKLLGFEKYFAKIYGKEDLVDKKKSLAMISEELHVPQESIIAIDDLPEMVHEQQQVIPIKKWLIGSNAEYEFQEQQDNLMGALQLALSLQGQVPKIFS